MEFEERETLSSQSSLLNTVKLLCEASCLKAILTEKLKRQDDCRSERDSEAQL